VRLRNLGCNSIPTDRFMAHDGRIGRARLTYLYSGRKCSKSFLAAVTLNKLVNRMANQ
jgi:hypothetical protein